MTLTLQLTSTSNVLIGITHVPKYVYSKIWFWILMTITIVVIFIHHNTKRKSKNSIALAKTLTYQNMGRGGVVIYKDSTSSINFNFQFGGGNCVAIIFIPNEAQWQIETKRLLEDRKDIIEFVAKQALQDQVSGGRYVITDDFIELHK